MKLRNKMLITLAVILVSLPLCACNYSGYDMVDTNYHFDRAIIKVGEAWIEVEISKWADTEDGEQITITAKDGKRYLVNSVNCTLIED